MPGVMSGCAPGWHFSARPTRTPRSISASAIAKRASVAPRCTTRLPAPGTSPTRESSDDDGCIHEELRNGGKVRTAAGAGAALIRYGEASAAAATVRDLGDRERLGPRRARRKTDDRVASGRGARRARPRPAARRIPALQSPSRQKPISVRRSTTRSAIAPDVVPSDGAHDEVAEARPPDPRSTASRTACGDRRSRTLRRPRGENASTTPAGRRRRRDSRRRTRSARAGAKRHREDVRGAKVVRREERSARASPVGRCLPFGVCCLSKNPYLGRSTSFSCRRSNASFDPRAAARNPAARCVESVRRLARTALGKIRARAPKRKLHAKDRATMAHEFRGAHRDVVSGERRGARTRAFAACSGGSAFVADSGDAGADASVTLADGSAERRRQHSAATPRATEATRSTTCAPSRGPSCARSANRAASGVGRIRPGRLLLAHASATCQADVTAALAGTMTFDPSNIDRVHRGDPRRSS